MAQTGDQEERRIDPTHDGKVVTYSEMLKVYSDQGLSEDDLKKQWSKLKKVLPWNDKLRVSVAKVVLLGDGHVGKTSLVNRFVLNTFSDQVESTIGADFISKSVKIGEVAVRLQLFDTAGQEKYESLAPSYIRDAKAAIVVYDISDRETYQHALDKWMRLIQDSCGEDCIIFLAGNKSDLASEPGERQVGTEEVKRKAKETGITFFESSAKTGDNVAIIFEVLAQKLCSAFGVSGNPDKLVPGRVQIVGGPEGRQDPGERRCAC